MIFNEIPDIATGELHFSKGEYIVRQDEDTRDLFVLLSGRVRVTKDSTVKMAVLDTPGTVIGEMAALTDQRRVADVVCETDVTVLKIPRKILPQVLTDYPSTTLAMAVGLAQRLEQTGTLLALNARKESVLREKVMRLVKTLGDLNGRVETDSNCGGRLRDAVHTCLELGDQILAQVADPSAEE